MADARRALRGAAVLLALAASCREPTEITVILSTDVAPCDARLVTALAVGAPGKLAGASPGATRSGCDSPGAPLATIGSIVLVPSGGTSDALEIRVAAGLGVDPETCTDGTTDARCIVARRRIRYEPHTRLSLPIVMRKACAGVACKMDETCVEGACVSPEVDPGKCGNACDEGSLGGTRDGGASDGGASDGGASDGKPIVASDAAGDGATYLDAGCVLVAPTGPSPGVIDCQTTTCTPPLVCCSDGTCQQDPGNCHGSVIECDEPADCPTGVCCLAGLGTTCAFDCAGAPVICKTTCDCNACTFVAGCAFPACGASCL